MLQGKMIVMTVLVLGLVGGHIAYAGWDNAFKVTHDRKKETLLIEEKTN